MPITEEEILARKRRVSLSVEEIDMIVTSLDQLILKDSAVVGLMDRLRALSAEERDANHRALVDAYRAAVPMKDGQMELDDDAEVSMGDDPGAYVMVWTWVEAVDAGVCVECGMPGADNGEGYDGMCGSCADAAEGGS